MRLISCHIENFGKLSNFNLSFNEGCNIICEENGWGKSTLMAFLRVMLFGFANEGKRNDLENERRRYKPWQGGAYGGSLTFEADGREYICYRTFGDKEKDDHFELRDAKSHLEVGDFTEKLGEELFQIDQESFFKSVCITQSQSDIRFAGTTGSMNAKLGNLIGEAGDITDFDAVDKKLSDLLNQMSPRRSTGSLNKENKEIQQYRQEIRQKEEIEKSIQSLKDMQQKELARKEALEAERGQVNEKQKQLVFAEKRKRYQELQKDVERKQEEYREQRNFFPAELPIEEELEQKIKTAESMEESRSAMEIYRLSEEEEEALKLYEQRFSTGTPKQEMLEEIRTDIQNWRNNQKKLEESELSEHDKKKLQDYQKKFAGGCPEEEELTRRINDWELRNRKKEALNTKEVSLDMARMMAKKAAEDAKARAAAKAAAKAEEIERQEAEKAKALEAAKKKKQRKLLLSVIGGILAAAGIGLMFCYLPAGIAALAAGILLVVLAVTTRAGQPVEETEPAFLEEWNEEDEEPAEALENEKVLTLEEEIRTDRLLIQKTDADLKTYLSAYGIAWDEYSLSGELHQMKTEVREYQNLLERQKNYEMQSRVFRNDELQQKIENFLKNYYSPESVFGGEYGELLQKLCNNVEKYRQLCEKRTSYQQCAGQYAKKQEELTAYLKNLSMEPENDLHAQLLEIRKHLHICGERSNTLSSALQLLKEYEEKEDCGILKEEPEAVVDESAEQLYERQTQISEQMERVQKNIHSYMTQLDDYEEEMENLNEKETLLTEMKEAYEGKLKKYHQLEKTQMYLRTAKEKFTEKYMLPLMCGFQKYYRMLTGEAAVGYRLDTNAVLTVEEQGLPRNPELLSAGYRDLVGLCMRMALVDAMYQDSRPFLLLDDPFVNYDDRKLAGAMEFLDKASSDYQMIYFTCQKQRKG
ncbi:MAG: ATP-binding protein [Lachnospiraceae bacterium]